MNLYGVVLSGRKVTGLDSYFESSTFCNPNVRIGYVSVDLILNQTRYLG